MNKTILKRYANLIASCGVSVQKGQDVVIVAGLDQPEFIEFLTEACYKRGARKVTVEWSHQKLDKYHYRYKSNKTLATVEKWEEAKLQHYVETLPCRIYIESDDPEGLKGVNQKKMAYERQQRFSVIKKYRDAMENKYQWCIACVPGAAWSKKLFPNLRKSQAIEKLWELILRTSRVTDDPIQSWKEHNKDLHDRCAYLNSLGIEKLHYTANNGTDLTVGMIPEGEFKGGGDTSLQGIFFNPNIPSEECFISPKRGEAEGVVYSSMPLSYQGELIEDFSIRFENGKAVEWHAKSNESLLTKMLEMDEGASYLGECALVPYESPVRQTGILFYNTLFDENAACHLALGFGFPDTIHGFENMSLEECRALGVNDSMIHVDFMIGTEDLCITAVCRNGQEIPVFKNGTWAF